MNKRYNHILRFGLSSFLILYIFTKINFQGFLFAFKNADIYFFFMAMFLQFINLPVRALKWKILLAVQGIDVSLKKLISITFIGAFFNNFLPTSMGGDFMRAYEISKVSSQKFKSVSTIILQRFTGGIAIVFFCLIGFIIGYKIVFVKNLVYLISLFALISFVLLASIFNIDYLSKLKIIKSLSTFDKTKIMENSYNSLKVYKIHKKECINILILSLFAEFIIIIYFYIIALSLHQKINILYFFILIPIISVIEMIPISINGIGIREGAFLYFFTQVGLLDYVAVSMSLFYFLQKFGISLIGGAIYSLRRDKKFQITY